MRTRENRLLVYLVFVAIISALLVNYTGLDKFFDKQIPPHSPDYFSKGYTKWEMNAQGALNSKLLSDELTHYSDDNTIQMVKPTMFFYNEKTPPWVINAETGLRSGDGKDLLLEGEVTISREKAPGSNPLSIHTRALKVKPDISYAETKAWAELISPPNRTTGTGMKLTFAPPIHVQLLANVKGKYEKK
ncbi:MAG: LPS export ABC transporter periplasmic protein LptC [Methylococcales bacterium]|nr:LPS export ABC transporter periplasmic protein LptC [Methylococcales bacterium]